jgi:phosphoglycolate phosphatase-like HAD superfamily hydrolase
MNNPRNKRRRRESMTKAETEASKKQLIKELREYLDKAEKDETTYCELLMEIPELLKSFNCD